MWHARLRQAARRLEGPEAALLRRDRTLNNFRRLVILPGHFLLEPIEGSARFDPAPQSLDRGVRNFLAGRHRRLRLMRNELIEPARAGVERVDDLAVVAAREGRFGRPQVQPRHLPRAMTTEAVLSQDSVCPSRKFLRGFLLKPGARSRQEEKHHQVEDARQRDKIAKFADDHLIPLWFSAALAAKTDEQKPQRNVARAACYGPRADALKYNRAAIHRITFPLTNTCAATRLLPKFVKSLNVQTTFLSRVTSMSCGFTAPACVLPKIRLPVGSCSSVVTHASVMPGNSF